MYEATDDGVRATITTVDAEGQTFTAQYTADYDSLEYPLTGAAQADTIELTRVDARTAEATLMHGTTKVGSARREISEDGKTMTIAYEGTDQLARRVSYVTVHEKVMSP